MKTNILDDIEVLYFDKNESKIFGIKSAVLWGRSKSENYIFPLLYISKPKCLTKEEFYSLLDNLEIKLKTVKS
jgi:hypothetical protein